MVSDGVGGFRGLGKVLDLGKRLGLLGLWLLLILEGKQVFKRLVDEDLLFSL